MKYLIPLALSFFIMQSAYAEKMTVYSQGAKFDPKACDITVDFSSFASGPDLRTRNAIEASVKQNKDIISIRSYPWGKEGESTLCLKIRTGKEKTVYQLLLSIIPKEARAPTSLKNNIDGHSFSNAY